MNADELLSRFENEAVEIRKMRHRIEDMANEYFDIDKHEINMDLSRMRCELNCAVHKMTVAQDCILSAAIYLRSYIEDGGI